MTTTSRSWTRRALAIAAAAITVLPLTAVTASAGETRPSVRVLEDGRSDMWRMFESRGGTAYRPAPFQQTGDILRARVAHGPRAVRTRLDFVDLDQVGEQFSYEVRLRAEGKLYGAVVLVDRGRWRGRLLFGDFRDVTPCAGKRHRLDYTANTLRIRIPRRCLGNPSWVKASIQYVRQGESAVPAFFDNPHNDGLQPYGYTGRIYRG